ncbi:MAG: YitT family protein, partial [Bacteroidaceae bacterium]|nr:YitT family protein [Bacteroidaceae bacterium]
MRRHLIIDFRDAWAEARDFLMIALGTALYCTGVVVFMLPYGLTTGGVSGLAMITFYSTGIPVQFTYFSVNILFLLAAVKVLGWRFCIKTIFGVSAATFWLWLFQLVIQNPVTHQLPRIVGDEMFMACVLGSIIEGIGLSFCFLHNGSMGGTDIIAAMVNKFRDISLGHI